MIDKKVAFIIYVCFEKDKYILVLVTEILEIVMKQIT